MILPFADVPDDAGPSGASQGPLFWDHFILTRCTAASHGRTIRRCGRSRSRQWSGRQRQHVLVIPFLVHVHLAVLMRDDVTSSTSCHRSTKRPRPILQHRHKRTLLCRPDYIPPRFKIPRHPPQHLNLASHGILLVRIAVRDVQQPLRSTLCRSSFIPRQPGLDRVELDPQCRLFSIPPLVFVHFRWSCRRRRPR